MNIKVGIMDQLTHRLTLLSICRSVTYILWSSDFASYLEDLFDGEMLYLG